MGVRQDGWNDDWNKDDDEMRPQEIAARNRHLEDAMWRERLSRGVPKRSPEEWTVIRQARVDREQARIVEEEHRRLCAQEAERHARIWRTVRHKVYAVFSLTVLTATVCGLAFHPEITGWGAILMAYMVIGIISWGVITFIKVFM